MKKNLLFIIASAAVAMISCAKEEMPAGEQPRQEIRTVNFTLVATGESSRAALSGSSVIWSAGDSMAVISDKGLAKLVTTDGGATASFTGEVPATTGSKYAVYPYQSACTLSNSTVTVSVKSEQKAVAGSFDPEAFVAMGLIEDVQGTQKAALKNLCALLEIDIVRSDVYEVKFYGNNKEKIAGSVKVPVTATPAVSEYVSCTDTVRLVSAKKNSPIAPGKYYIAILPQNFTSGFSIEYNKIRKWDIADCKPMNVDAKYTGSTAYNLQRGHCLPLGSKESDAICTRQVNLGTFYSDVANSKYFDGVVPTSKAKYFGSFNTPITERVDFPYCFSSPDSLYKYSSKSCVRIANKFELPFFAHKKLVTINIKTALSLDGNLKDSQDNSVGSVLCPNKKATLNTFTSTVEGEKYSITTSGNIDIVAIVFTYEGPDVEEVCAVTVAKPTPDAGSVTLNGQFYAWNYGGSNDGYTAWIEYKKSDAAEYTHLGVSKSGQAFSAMLSSLAAGTYTFRAYAQKGSDKAIHSQDRTFTISE